MAPTVFHLTHWKAGSQWVRAVLEAAAPSRIVRPPGKRELDLNGTIVPGGIYTPIYLRHDTFRKLVPDSPDHRAFAVIRDPRDTAVSWYFSLLHSHSTRDVTVEDSRQLLSRLDKTDGLALVISNHLADAVRIQRSWLQAGATVFRYEELLRDQQGAFARILEFSGVDLPPRRRQSIVRRNSFARRTWFRFGRESLRSHLRKGVAGDWQNHFDARLKKLFKFLYQDDLLLAGYETTTTW